jgi:hypothetical protein
MRSEALLKLFAKNLPILCLPFTPVWFNASVVQSRGSIERCGSPVVRGGRRKKMLETIVVVLVVLWLLGMVSSYTMGGLVHILLVFAVIVLLLRVIQGRQVL